MEPSEVSLASSHHRTQPLDASLEAYNLEMLRQAELESELKIRRANIGRLTEDIAVLAKEVKREQLVEKWGSTPTSDGEGRVKPAVQAASLCHEVAANPEALDDVLMKLHYQKAKLQSEVAEVMSKLKEYKVME